jgi:hypothetical protein
MMRQGSVAVEIKSGYGLDLDSELKMLRVVKRLKAELLPLQIKATLLRRPCHSAGVQGKPDRLFGPHRQHHHSESGQRGPRGIRGLLL